MVAIYCCFDSREGHLPRVSGVFIQKGEGGCAASLDALLLLQRAISTASERMRQSSGSNSASRRTKAARMSGSQFT